MGHRYQSAVEAIILADALVRPKWRSLEYLISNTKSLFELGIIGVAQDMLQAQAAMMEILRKEYQRPPSWYEREQSWLTAQDAMDMIYAYRQKHLDAGSDYCAAFKAHKNQEDKDVERARRVLRVFWDITVGMYTAGDLPESFFGRGVWLIRAYMELVKPIEIANYYRCQNWKRWTKGKRHYIEGKRPKRFPFFEAQYAQHYPTEKLAPVLHQAQCEADAVDAQELAAAEA
ncbi:hypothetical protein WJX75_002101 [Coccomyxa subellipsoidea]|uniref:EDS1 EP domain-containing protein n=1 Tax=Coccomyxa subellipsoidea TaxID=248742 RepID=A0ABR2YFZ5_9CHLO